MKIKVYTDGACSENPGPGGWAAIFNLREGCRTVSGHDTCTTNNRMELTAMIEALTCIANKFSKSDIFEIYSDSTYVINAINNKWINIWLNNGWKNSRGDMIKNSDLWVKYLNITKTYISKGKRVTFHYIKGHAGNTFNEYADKVAKKEVMKARQEMSGESHA